MSEVEARLAEHGSIVPEVAIPVAAYIPAVRTGNLVFTSGQLPFASGELLAVGHVGDVVDETAAAAAALWACAACTYAGNAHNLLACDICGQTRGVEEIAVPADVVVYYAGKRSNTALVNELRDQVPDLRLPRPDGPAA